jgi:hypothetical protein
MRRIMERGVSITKPNVIQSNSTIHIKNLGAFCDIMCESNAPLVAVTLTESVCGLNRMRTRSIRHFRIEPLAIALHP